MKAIHEHNSGIGPKQGFYNLFRAFFLFSAPLTALLVAALFIDFDPLAAAPLAPASPPVGDKPRPNADPVRPSLLLPSTLASAVERGAGDACRSCLNPDPSFSIDLRVGGAGDDAFRVTVNGRPSLLTEVVDDEVDKGGVDTVDVVDEEGDIFEEEATDSSTTVEVAFSAFPSSS